MSKNGSQGANYAISQNFLTSRATIQRCLSLARLGPQDTVLEIGTGKGHITRALACRCKRVLTYEIDPDLCRTLEGKLPGNVRLVRGDFLRAPLPKGPYKVFANIPFSLTSAIVSKLTTGPNLPSHMYLFMEKGAAKRFCGLPGESRASLLLRPWFDVKILYHFRREDFHPAPRTDVVLVSFRRRAAPDLTAAERRSYDRFITQGLAGRLPLTRRQVDTALRRARLQPPSPSANMKYVQWLCLFRAWQGRKGK